MSWWNLARGGSGYQGAFTAHRVTCPYCGAKGRFNLVSREERKAQTAHGGLYFDLWKCAECSNLIFVLWGTDGGLHQYEVFPPPKELPAADPSWPEPVARAYLQARKSLESESWDAAATMARRAIQAAVRHLGAKPGQFRDEIKELAGRGLLSASLVEWATEVRLLGNVGAHPDAEEPAVAREDAADVVTFAQYFLDFVYTIPRQIAEHRAKRQKSAAN